MKENRMHKYQTVGTASSRFATRPLTTSGKAAKMGAANASMAEDHPAASKILEGALSHSGWLEEQVSSGQDKAVLTRQNPGLQVSVVRSQPCSQFWLGCAALFLCFCESFSFEVGNHTIIPVG
jgi:hypothetical protein